MLPDYIINYSLRKTLSIRINRKGALVVSAPIGISEKTVHHFVECKKERIIKKIAYIKNSIPDTTINVSTQMKEHALIQILPRVEYYADMMNLSYNNIKITTAQTKWWSCSNRWVLMFHWKLSLFPIHIVDYVIVHELAHLVHFNHSKQFWSLVEQYHPDYKSSKKRLKDNGSGLWIW